jgi:anti-sigma factor RsiW
MHPSRDPWNDRLSDYLDDEFDANERAQIETHLQGCATCRADLAAIRQVAARAARLVDVPPDGDLWPGIAERIGAPHRAAATRPVRRFAFTLPQLVAASLALMLLSGAMVWLARLGGPQTDFPALTAGPATGTLTNASSIAADAAYNDAVGDLQRILESGRARLDQDTVRVLENNLRTIDRAIAQCHEALAADPANAYLNGYLAEAKARKIRLLRRATAIVESSS